MRRIADTAIGYCRVTMTFALAAGIMLAIVAVSPTVARAQCVANHANVDGEDFATSHWGNGGTVYVSTQATINSLHTYIYRSLFVFGPETGEDVEVGWTDRWNGIENFPYPYAEWVDVGIKDPGAQIYTGSDIAPGQDRIFKVQNTGHVNIFRFYFDDEGAPFNYSPTMSFQTGLVADNSEHWNNCDSMWAHFYDLEYFDSAGNWHTPWDDLSPGECTSVHDWKFYDPNGSNSENYVDQDLGSYC